MQTNARQNDFAAQRYHQFISAQTVSKAPGKAGLLTERFVLLTGCSGGGKTTLLNALSGLGLETVPEPGRRIVADELAGKGKALPWVDLQAFALRAIEIARSDLEAAHRQDGLVFFDRGLVDAAVVLEHTGGPSANDTIGKTLPYAKQVFVFPPWRENFVADAERRHDFDAAVHEYHRLSQSLDDLGFRKHILPKVTVGERVEIVLSECGAR